ncbi:autophagy-related protein 9A isoform X1 [Apis cerana]|uniref:Autophagy-related protein 9 n=1 Tax=Apis cerana cerana TaxID=94128 RepID=A0A2A3EQ00_APICC|nr:autophagy-related protein 9A isoform X1 [Apis cerana]XP_016922384.1 autophagy-related protein 9A isoform X1 [Apis cerana]XP_016922385.1 autophagy-related protein 9A isoform X1 [Apis cerana]XP_016922387.1 autophagy-related protein 9A isoform X1 [Apis cerana]XP_016922388.1 autophagy-related protein 9A isoform X1 [Apis cerana]XP_061934031.1 autophagy-related protein 9A isoform X1 [Apis cerana]PBC33306.1 Autophagy-relatedA [Apis cerana cerana]
MKRETVITCVEPNRRAKTMTTVLDGSYQRMEPYDGEEEDGEDDDEHEETPQESGVMIHVVPEGNKARWNHVEDLDSFFTRMYHYHQKHGFACMILQEALELGQFIFVVTFSTFLFHCINYSLLFKNGKERKISISDVILSTSECVASMGLITWICILVAAIFWILRLVKVLYHCTQFWDIKLFFNTALKIEDCDLDNLTWHEIQKRVREVQKEQEMCIHKRELTELDIYHRILRFKNYMVAMINKSLLPVRLKVPIIGEIIFLTRGLKYNMELLLFWGPWSPFENNWHLKEDYKKLNKRQELARALSKHILWVGIVNFLLCPLILLWQILYSFFNYGEIIKREPGTLGTRMWSLYGRLYLRHFNELDHELNARLNRAYRPASKYMSMFTSPIMTVIAKNVAFVAGSILAVLLILTVYDEDVLTVEHVLTTITILGAIVAGARAFIPDENLVWCPETLLTAVLAHTHYRPDSWRGHAHTQTTRAEVAQLFQYRAVHLLEELISPLITPFILCFRMRQRALDIVDFYRNFTIEVTGVGDVCSFAQMDVRKHGNPMWQTATQITVPDRAAKYDNQYATDPEKLQIPISDQYTQAEDGKTELSLIHFTLTNPEWKPPSHAENFVTALRERVKKDVHGGGHEINPLLASLNSLSGLGPGYNDIISNIIRSTIVNQASGPSTSTMFTNQPCTTSVCTSGNEMLNMKSDIFPHAVQCGLSKAEGPVHNEKGLLYGLQQEISNQSLGASVFVSSHEFSTDLSIPVELIAADMSLSTLYLHELHHRQVRRRGYQELAMRSVWQRSPVQELATLPEVRQERAPLLLHQDSSIRNNREFKYNLNTHLDSI